MPRRIKIMRALKVFCFTLPLLHLESRKKGDPCILVAVAFLEGKQTRPDIHGKILFALINKTFSHITSRLQKNCTWGSRLGSIRHWFWPLRALRNLPEPSNFLAKYRFWSAWTSEVGGSPTTTMLSKSFDGSFHTLWSCKL